MIESKKLLSDLQKVVKSLEEDLRERCEGEDGADAGLREEYEAAKGKGRTAFSYEVWREAELCQIAVGWVLGCVFVRFLEDNRLVEVPRLSGPGDRLGRARDEHELYIREHPTDTVRDYLEETFRQAGELPAMKEFFDARHNPVWKLGPGPDAARALWNFWQQTDPETGDLLHDFTHPSYVPDAFPSSELSLHSSQEPTRFLGDLYQDLSEAARKRYALLQTPDFVEEFILDRTLTPAIETFGYETVRMIDPTCGSGHFLLGSFHRLFALWQREEVGENPTVLAQKALDGVYGVDLNPFAVAIARFRLLLAALRECGVSQLKDAPDFRINLAVGDSLLHGARFNRLGQAHVEVRQATFDTEELFKDELAHFFEAEDSAELHRILGQQYHAVVGNPPYIAEKDSALKKLYKGRYGACSGRWVLSVPFMERFFDLAVSGEGFVGQITSNSFMKRSFGEKLVEQYVPTWDLDTIIDASVAYLPGHGTPTVILFGRNRSPKSDDVKAILGIRGEPSPPKDPARGVVWSAILRQIDIIGSESTWVSCSSVPRVHFSNHPWSLTGGGAMNLKARLEQNTDATLDNFTSASGITAVTGEDDLYVFPDDESALRLRVERTKRLMVGTLLRDYKALGYLTSIWLYDEEFKLLPLGSLPNTHKLLWPARAAISRRKRFGTLMVERGLSWYEWQELYKDKLSSPLTIAFPDTSTCNHFVLLDVDQVYKSTAPVLKLKSGLSVGFHQDLASLLNSSIGCFWTQQVFHNKGGPGGGNTKDEK